jgi:hypothetical protein
VEQYKHMRWDGSVESSLSALRAAAEHPGDEISSETYWQPGRILKGIIDSEIDGEDKIELVGLTTEVALETLAQGPSPESIEGLRDVVHEYGLDGKRVYQRPDGVTATASSADLSAAAAERISSKIGDKPAIILPICYGGFSAGIETALYFQRAQGDTTVDVYPIRFSSNKYHDEVPLIDPAERDMIAEQCGEKTVIVYDEDAFSGLTVAQVVGYLDEHLPKDATIIGITNFDKRDDGDIRDFGEWWEKCRVDRDAL